MNITFDETKDPSGIKCGPDHYQECSRDPVRTPFQWNADNGNAGFSDGPSTWLPVNSDYKDGVNVKVMWKVILSITVCIFILQSPQNKIAHHFSCCLGREC